MCNFLKCLSLMWVSGNAGLRLGPPLRLVGQSHSGCYFCLKHWRSPQAGTGSATRFSSVTGEELHWSSVSCRVSFGGLCFKGFMHFTQVV